MQKRKAQSKLKYYSKNLRIKSLTILFFLIVFPMIISSPLFSKSSRELDNIESEITKDLEIFPSSSSPPNVNYFNFWKDIVIDNASVSGSGNHLNFPVLISLLDTDLRYDVQPDGDDIAFSISNTWLDHEIELFYQEYSASEAQLVAWVRVPSLSTSVDTVICMYYGNSTMSSRQNPESVWDSDYEAIYHLHDDFLDSTINNRGGTNGGSADIAGIIGDGQDFEENDLNDNINIGTWSVSGTEITIQAWVKFESFDLGDARILSKNSGISDGTEHHVWMLGTETVPNRLRGRIKVGTSDFTETTTVVATSGDLTTGTWYLTTLIYDRPYIRFVLDGIAAGSFLWEGNLRVNDWAITIGNNPTLDKPLDAITDEVRISSKARSTDWLLTEYNNQYDPSTFYTIGAEQLVSTQPPNAKYFSFYKVITIDNTKVSSSGSHVNFPLLISRIDTDLRFDVQEDGDDIAFAMNGKWLDHEIELFNQTYSDSQAELIAWIRVPFLSTAYDTNITIYYSNNTMNSRQNPTGVWDTSYRGVWHLNELSGGTDAIKDSTQYYNDGTDYNNPTFGDSGQIYDSIEFSYNSGERIDVPDDPSLDITDELTVEAWIKPSTYTGNWRSIVSKMDGSWGNGNVENYDIYTALSPDNYYFIGLSSPPFAYDEWQTTFQATAQTWQHFAFTYSSYSSVGRVYTNGVYRGLYNFGLGTLATNNNPFYIGFNLGWTNEVFDGFIDEVRISSATRTTGWISSQYENQNDPNSFYTVGTEQAVFPQPPGATHFNYYKIITIDNTKVSGSGSHLNFPLLISVIDTDLRFDVQPDGDDIAFSVNGKWLDHEIERFNQSYSSTHAKLVAWVRIPYLSTAEDTNVSMYYSNGTMSSRHNPTEVWDSNFKGIWHFREDPSGSPPQIKDSTSPYSNGSSNGFMTPVDQVIGSIDGSLDFDGNDDYIDFANPPELQITGEFTVELWFKSDNVGNDYLINKMGASGQRGWDISFDNGAPPNGWVTFRYNRDGTNFGSESVGYEFVKAGEWYHVVGIFKPNDYAKFFLNGTLVDIDTTLIPASMFDPSLPVRVAERSDGSSTNYNGTIDEVRISDIARSDGWISTEYYNQDDPGSFYSIGSEKEAKALVHLQANVIAIDLYGNSIPNVNITMTRNSEIIGSEIADINGSVIFSDLVKDNYNFSVILNSYNGMYSEVVNTTSTAILIENVYHIIHLICNVSSNFFEMIDVDNKPVESGWILVGNSSTVFQNCTIDTSGHAKFWWLNITPYEYNYTAFYQDNNYNPKIIKIASGNITTVNSSILVNTNLTTVRFTVLTLDTIEFIGGITLNLTNTNTGFSIVNLTTDINGEATLRWLNSTNINSNYTLQLRFFGQNKDFNMSDISLAFTKKVNFTVKSEKSYTIRVILSLADYQTKLISLNPTTYIELEWETNLKLRILFNVTKAGGITDLLGPIYADMISYQIIKGVDTIQAGTVFNEVDNVGVHYAVINTKELQSDSTYLISIAAQKSGFSLPSNLLFQLNLINNNLELNQSENDNSIKSTYWLEPVNMSVKSYGKKMETFTIEDQLFKNPDGSFNFSIPSIQNNWNLSQIKFDIFNISWNVGDPADINISILDPYGILSIFNSTNHLGGDYYESKWTGLIINISKASPTENNNFDFSIGGSFNGTVDVVAEAQFIRDDIHVQYLKYNVTNEIIILTESEGWAIKNITFHIRNCYNISNWQKVNLSTLTNLNITNNEGFKYTLKSGDSDGNGILNIDDRLINPLDNQFLFIIENSTNIIFDTIIEVEYIQEFYQNLFLENLNHTEVENEFNKGIFSINVADKTFINGGATLWIYGIKNKTHYLLPSDLEMNITVGLQEYSVNDDLLGQGFLSLDSFNKVTNYMAIVETNQQVNFTLAFNLIYSRNIIYEVQGDVSYVIREAPSIYGTVQYDANLGSYLQTIDTSLIDADDYTIRFTIDKENYESDFIDLELGVISRPTLINGSVEFFRKIENVYAMEAKNFTFHFSDMLTYKPITNLIDQSCIWESYDDEGNVIENGDLNLITRGNSYVLDFDTEYLPLGNYLLIITLDKTNYDYKNGLISLTILERPTYINGSSQLATIQKNIYVWDQLNFSFSYTDVRRSENISGLSEQSYKWIELDDFGQPKNNGSGNLVLNSDNLYVLDFETETRNPGSYELTLTLNKYNYTSQSATILLTVNKRYFSYSLSENFQNNQINVVKGKTVTIDIQLTDETQNINLTTVTVYLMINGDIFNFEESGNGIYQYEFKTSNIDTFFNSKTFTGTINISKENYISEEFSITIVVEMEEIFPGVPSFYFYLILSILIAFTGSIVAYKVIVYSRIPTFVKKVRSIKKAIEGSKLVSESDLYQDKEVFIGEIIKNRWDKLGLSIAEIFGIKIEKEIKDLQLRKRISERTRVHGQKPLGLLLMKWDEKIGTELFAKYPEDINVSEKTLMQVYSTHEYSGEKGVITLTAESLNILSYYTGQEEGYYLLLFLNLDDDPDVYEGGMPDILRIILENLKDDSYLQLIPELFQRLSVYPSLSDEEILALHYQNSIKRIIINILREDGVITKSELMIWLKDKHIEGFFDLEAIVSDLIKMDIIKVGSIKGIPSELIFLTKDLFMLRTPPVKLLEDPVSYGLPTQFLKEYPKDIKEFFQDYQPTEEDNIKIIKALINPQVYEMFRLLRVSIATRQDLEKLKKKGVDDIYSILKILWDNKLIKVYHDEKNNEYYALLTDFYVDYIFPKYLLTVVKTAYEQKSKIDKVLLEYLHILEETYFESKSKKKKTDF